MPKFHALPGGRSAGKPLPDRDDPFSDLISNLVLVLRATGAEIVGFGRDDEGAFLDWRPPDADRSLEPMRSVFQRNPKLRLELAGLYCEAAPEDEGEIPVVLDPPAIAEAAARAEASAAGVIFLDERRR